MAINIKWAVNFDPKEHQYTDQKGNRLRSVTEIKDGLMNRTWEDKKEELVMFNKNKAPHITAEFLDERREIGGKRGRIIHEQLERWTSAGGMDTELTDEELKLNPKFWQRLTCQLQESDLIEYDKHYAEVMLADPENGLCGIADLVSTNGERLILSDWKTNKQIGKTGTAMMIPPFDHLPNSDLNGYAVQLSLYRWLLVRNGNAVDERMFLRRITETGYIRTHILNYIPQVERLFDF